MVEIRTIRTEDAQNFLNLSQTLDTETQWMMLEPGERQFTVEQQARRIHEILASENSTLLVAEEAGALVGFLAARGGDWRRNRHAVYIVVGVLQAHVGQGVGTQFFTELERWATARKVHRLELTVMANNQRAIALYQKMGFSLEGTKKDALFVNGAYVDEYMMAKLLPAGGGKP
jgi:RimJ/RimL family protein N-acetyltransferase